MKSSSRLLITLFVIFCGLETFAQDVQHYGIFSSQYPNSNVRFPSTCALFVWENTCQLSEKQFEGSIGNDRYLQCKYTPVKNWYGFGYCVQPESPGKDLSRYMNGYLIFYVRTTTGILTKIGIKSGESIFGEEAWISDLALYGFRRTGQWEKICIPINDFLAQNRKLDLSSISQYFMVAGEELPQINIVDFHNIYWSTIRE
jgi:hypothetical protein